MPEDRFSRERRAGYDPDVMQAGTMLFAGAGALAQLTLTNVALPGVGELRVVDFDEFEPHNAARSLYYPTPQEQREWGLNKATIVANKARRMMLADRPVMRFATSAIQALGLGAFAGVNVVVAGVDNPRARAYLSDACRTLGIALIEAGFDGPAVSMSCFPPTTEAGKPCYRCGNPSLTGTFSCQRVAIEAKQAGFIPAIQPAAATLAGLQAEAAIQALHGNFPTGFKRTALNVRTGEGRQYMLAANPGCEGVHHRLAASPAPLPVGPRDALGDLVAAVEAELGPGAIVELPEPFVIEAYCLRCGDVARVEAPEWAFDMTPRCTNCDGPWPSLGRCPEGHSPTKPVALGAHCDPATLGYVCERAGLPALAIVTAASAGGECSRAFQLAGTLDDLFQTVA